MKYSIFLGIFLFRLGCGSPDLEPIDYVHWVEDEENGLKVSKVIDDFKFTLQYKPLEYLVAKQEKTHELETKVLNTELKKVEGMQYYTFSIGSADGQSVLLKTGLDSEVEYYERINYFSFEMQRDLFLVQDNDTLPCKLFHFERTYNLMPMNNIVLGFELTEEEQSGNTYSNKTLIYNDRMLDMGTVRLTIKGENIGNLPKMKTI